MSLDVVHTCKTNRISGGSAVDRLYVHRLPWSQYVVNRSDDQYLKTVGYG